MSNTTGPEKGDGRAAAIGNVWWASLAMLGVCIPLCAILKSASLPFIVIGMAASVTLYIWHHPIEVKPRKKEKSEAEALREQIAELEARLANVEVINAYGEKLAERERERERERGEAEEPVEEKLAQEA